ncbi:MAG: ABC transporter ATP-binding protein/permease, partial [bacterium]|nr:ABC transporter ATP-binding protein/permease [bacterium]
IGGLDRYDSGDLIINGISTKEYKERDWDTYRNHSIGFVFQNYNLIPHQSILANVELALTISGIPKSARKLRAKQALESVGLGDQCHKRPNQLSGGQMQRVAIARALVNNPEILLADEPTGALDSETSIQVMELLREVAKDRLVIMVTHNPELAKNYANRIVQLKDGKITADTNPFMMNVDRKKEAVSKPQKKASMSPLTALSLSFHNLATKKGRTILTAFAGSIGIIGIALILSLSNGVSSYMEDIQKNTMTSYPISIEKESIDLTNSFVEKHKDMLVTKEAEHPMDAVYATGDDLQTKANLANTIRRNNLTAFTDYLNQPDCEINQYVGENGIQFTYQTAFDVFTYDPNGEFLNTNGSPFAEAAESAVTEEDSHGHMSEMMDSAMSGTAAAKNKNFGELTAGTEDILIGNMVTDNYDLVYGAWPEKYNEVTLILDQNQEVSSSTLYELGILPAEEYRAILEQIDQQDTIQLTQTSLSYEELCRKSFYLIPACDTYLKNNKGTFDCISDNNKELEGLLDDAVELKISGIIKVKDPEAGVMYSFPIGYTKALTNYLIDYSQQSEVVKAQAADPTHNVLNNTHFTAVTDEEKIEDASTYLKNMGISEKAELAKMLMEMMAEKGEDTQQAQNMTEQELAGILDKYLENPEDDEMLEAYAEFVPATTYETNMEKFGYVDKGAPFAVNIYADDFESKEAISKCIDNYNATVAEEDQITYTDYVGTLMSSVTTIINVISYVLMAFVAVSLIVSSIMIGIITYISVLERTKEIGVLRAIGASKHNISQVFCAETFIIGLISGAIGIGITLLLLIPGNLLIHSLVGVSTVNASLPVLGSFVLVVLSVVLTLIGGFIPSRHAARKDPVSALRSE